MIKSLLAAPLLAAAALAGTLVPAQANPTPMMAKCNAPLNYVYNHAQEIKMLLRSRGYDVQSVEQWGACVRAFVKDDSGHSVQRFFMPYTLEPIELNN